ncbi:hypothetical protein U9M48_040801 [Paspalum notatum var. saurae]|uniref:F-box domain-containing protein n=1 Tax=Paspalum notatum var. saurae TaxID=547442 RepID=A0AAQ3UNZ5_PASNO
MPRANKRACVASRQPSAGAAADANPRGGDRGLLSVRRAATSRQPRSRQADDDDGTWFPDEIILFIFASFLDLADLVRCAATCRRWRRLVSSEAAFICRNRTPQWPGNDRFLPPVVAGFFHQRDDEEPRFLSTPAACRRFPALGAPPPLSALVEDGSSVDLDSCRIVASRNGLLVAELRRGKNNRALKLCVCNPMSGERHVLPPLSGKDGVGHYACTVLTADECQHDDGTSSITPPSLSSFRVVVVYSRRTFTATRRYSSADGSWGAEAKVDDAHVGKKAMGLMRNGVVARGGRVAYWLAGETVFGMHLDTLVATSPMKVPWSEEREVLDSDNSTLLGTTRKGKLFAVQLRRPFRVELGKRIETIELSVLTLSNNGAGYAGYGGAYVGRIAKWEEKFKIRVDQFLPDGALTTKVKLQWFCEKSGLVFFNVSGWYVGDPGQRRSDVYALSFGTRSIQKVATNGGGKIYGYEMDQAAYLASLSH